MAYRYTNTEKWNDAWFVSLTKNQKLLFLYICDNCDIAGFIEINTKRWQADLDMNSTEIKGALEGLGRGLIISESMDCAFVKNYLKHQKNLPLNERNNAHVGIIKRFELYKYKFNFTKIEDLVNQQDKPLPWGYGNGNGNGNGNGSDINAQKIEKTWREDYEIYLSQLREAWRRLTNDPEWMKEREKFNPGVDILLSLEKSCKEFWATEAGWKHKKKYKTNKIDWKATFNNMLSIKSNRVYVRTTNQTNGLHSGRNDAANSRRELEALRDLSEAVLQNIAGSRV